MECTCRIVRLDFDPVGLDLNEECEEHGIGTEYYRERVAYYDKKLRELRDEKRRRNEPGGRDDETGRPDTDSRGPAAV
jgi:hypothetical protein